MGCVLRSSFRIRLANHLKFYDLRKSFAAKSIILESHQDPVLIPHNELLHEYIFEGMMRWPGKIATECAETGRKYSYNEIYRNSISFAGFLNSLKINTGDTLSIVLPNVPEYPIVLLGGMLANLKVSTVNPRFTADEMSKLIELSETKVVVTTKEAYPVVTVGCRIAKMQSVKFIILNNEAGESIPEKTTNLFDIWKKPSAFEAKSISSVNTALLPFSSGTTGMPKAVELSHYSLVANLYQATIPAFNLCEETTAEHQTTVAGILPFFHIFGLASILLTHLRLGAKIVTLPKFSSQSFIKYLYNHKPEFAHLVPPIVHMITNHEEITPSLLEPLRSIVCGAASIGNSDLERFADKCNRKTEIYQAYGMTEASPLVTQQTQQMKNRYKSGAIGYLLPNTEAKVVFTDECHSQEVDSNRSGELHLKGPQIMKGYYRNKEATKETITEGGWLKTGDIVRYDEEGQLYITGRLKELIKVKGYQVAPAELEALIRTHPQIKDAAVIGIPDSVHGEVPRAFIVVKNKSDSICQEIQRYVADNASPYKRLIGGVTQIDEIPKTPSGKIIRKRLRHI